MRTYALAFGVVLLCLSFVLQGLVVAQLAEVRELAVSTEMPKPHQILTLIGRCHFLSIGVVASGVPGFALLIFDFRFREKYLTLVGRPANR